MIAYSVHSLAGQYTAPAKPKILARSKLDYKRVKVYEKLLINLLARWNIVSLFALLALMSGCSMLGLGGDPELTIKVTTHQYTNNGNNFYLLVAQDNNKSYISHSYYSLYSQFNSSQYQRYFITPKYESSYSFSYPLDQKSNVTVFFIK